MNQPKIKWTEYEFDGRKAWRSRAPNGYLVQVAEPLAMPGLPAQPILRVLARSPWWYGRAVLSVDVADGLDKAQQHAIDLAQELQELVERIHGRDAEALKLRFTRRDSAIYMPG